MTPGLRVEVGVASPGTCPVAGVSADTGSPVTSVSRATTTDATGQVAEEFTVSGAPTPSRESVTEVASYDSHAVYRFHRSPDRPCVCEQIEACGFPVSDVHAADGTLYASFHAPDVATVQEIVTGLRERFSGIRLRKLVRFDERSDADLAFVDRSRLTARQREVLQTAFDMGYFDHPKGANAGDVAAALEIAPSTFTEHLAAAQRKVLEAILRAD